MSANSRVSSVWARAACTASSAPFAEQGFVVKTDDDRYRLGLKLHALGQLAGRQHLELRTVAHGPLERLRNDCGETVHVAVLEGSGMYVHRIESQATLRTFSRVGRRAAGAHHVVGQGVARAWRAGAGGRRGRTGLPASARGRSPTNALREVLRKIRRDGYVVSVEENERGVVGASAHRCSGTTAAASRRCRWPDRRCG
ncbi:MAG: hypothetical protein R2713_22980 [Ilumatobacteraceae bacterium]